MLVPAGCIIFSAATQAKCLKRKRKASKQNFVMRIAYIAVVLASFLIACTQAPAPPPTPDIEATVQAAVKLDMPSLYRDHSG